MIVRYENSEAERFRLNKIIDGKVDCFLPLSILTEGAEILGLYDNAGYEKLRDIFFDSEKIFDFSLLFFDMVEKMRDRLFFPDRMILNCNNIFLDEKLNEIKIIYIKDRTAWDEVQKITCLFGSIKRKCPSACRGHIDEIISAYKKNKRDIYRITAAINEIKRKRDKEAEE